MISRQKYLDGVKGILCNLIMIGHLLGLYHYAENGSLLYSKFVDIMVSSPFSLFFAAEGFWLYGFFVISGYLLYFTSPTKLSNSGFFPWMLIKKFFHRFLRLACPILGTAIIIYLLQLSVGFHTQDIQTLVQNSWIADDYDKDLSLAEVFLSPINVLFFQDDRINGPFWPLSQMLFASGLIYCIRWFIVNKIQVTILFLCTSFIFFINHLDVISACLIGSLAASLFSWFSKQKISLPFLTGGIFLPAFTYFIKPLLPSYLLVLVPIIYSFAFSIFLLCISRVQLVRAFLEFSLVQALGTISFGIYALHWPIFNSIGLWLLFYFSSLCPLPLLYPIVVAISILLTFILAVVFNKTVEKLTTNLCKIV